MLVAALLFIAGLILGWNFNAFALVLSSAFIYFGAVALFMATLEVGVLQVLLLFAYLLAHQAGYLVGGYLSYGRSKD